MNQPRKYRRGARPIPGEWMMHCHIAAHLHAGMMLSFSVNNEEASR